VNGVQVKKGGQVLVPNAFSPSGFGGSGGGGSGGAGDGKNDVFLPLMRGVTEFELLIFNRWGELLFESTDATRGWDGYYNGKLCQQDVYMYKLTARFENGENVVRVGDINLIR
jgi:gliding motility-associated-like protein